MKALGISTIIDIISDTCKLIKVNVKIVIFKNLVFLNDKIVVFGERSKQASAYQYKFLEQFQVL